MHDYYTTAIVLLTVAACTASIVYDLRERRIPNFITLPSILMALFLHFFYGGMDALSGSFFGMLLGGGVFFIIFALGGMGAGDVKLMAAAGALLGLRQMFSVFILTAFAGGILAMISITKNRSWGKVWRNIRFFFSALLTRTVIKQDQLPENTNSSAIPYGLAIGAGALITLYM